MKTALTFRTLAIVLLSLGLIQMTSCTKKNAGDATTGESAAPSAATTDAGLKIEDLKVGDGPEAQDGKTLVVHYTGWLTDGTKFDSSLDRNQPFPFQLGAGHVIKGWDQGMKGMRVGGKRKLTIPPELGYGDRGAGATIPPNATLVFEVELIEVK